MEIVEFAEKARQSIMEQLATPSKLGLASPNCVCAHSDAVYQDYLNAVEPINARLYEFAAAAQFTKDEPLKKAVEIFVKMGVAAEKEMLAAWRGRNLLKGTFFALSLITCAYFRTQSLEGSVDIVRLSSCIAEMAALLPPTRDTHGANVRETYGLGGARESALSGYAYVVSTALPIYRGFLAKGLSKAETNQRVLLRLISAVDDTCVMHRAPSLAEDVKTIADYLCNNFNEENISAALSYFERCSISTGGSGDLLTITLLFAKLFPTIPKGDEL